MYHPRTFCHSRNRYCFPIYFNFCTNLFCKSVRCHNRSCGIISPIFRYFLANFTDSSFYLFHIQLNPNNSSRLYQNLLFFKSQLICCKFCHFFSIFKSSFSSTRVSISAIYNNRLCISIFYIFHIQNNRSRLYKIFCKNCS